MIARLQRPLAIAVVTAAVAVALGIALTRRDDDQEVHCAAGFVRSGTRCALEGTACPAPLQQTGHGCDAPDVRVLVPAAAVASGPSDWAGSDEQIRPRVVRAQAFRIDAFEVTLGRWNTTSADPARAANAIARPEAERFCESQGGRLPTEDEWIVAATSATNPQRRYPWGDTGAVCRRAAWGLSAGPCARGADGPDTVGTHPDGDSPLGMHDVAGNVAEWVAAEPARPTFGVAKGGSWAATLATELGILARLELAPEARDPRVGVRCAYPP